jgi:hypothetical protein
MSGGQYDSSGDGKGLSIMSTSPQQQQQQQQQYYYPR